jgi:signal transduction histidine kinase
VGWLIQQLLRYSRTVAAIACLAGILFTLGVCLDDWRSAGRAITDGFRNDASRQFNLLQEELEEAITSASSAADFLQAVERLDRAQFREFVRGHLERSPELLALAWAPRIPDTGRLRFEAAGRRRPGFPIGAPDDQGRPAPRRPEYFPVWYRETLTGSDDQWVVDGWGDGSGGQALRLACDTGHAAATSAVGGTQHIQVYWPVYRRGKPRGTVEERREALRGFVGADFDMPRLIEPFLGPLGEIGIDVVLRDQEAPSGERALYSRRPAAIDPPWWSWAGPALATELGRRSRWTGTLSVGGRQWVASLTPTAGYIASRLDWQVWEDLLLGLLTTGAVSGFVFLLMRRTEEVERIVAARTGELQRANRRLVGEMAERTRAEAVARRLTQEILSVQEEERRRLSRELHDEAGQSLSGLVLHLQLLQDDVPEVLGTLRQRLREGEALVREAAERIRLLARHLRPPALDTLGLNASLRGLCHEVARRTGLSIAYAGTEIKSLPDPIATCLYRVLQEALTNVVRHAQGNRITVVLQEDAEGVTLSVADDGQGFEPAGVDRNTLNGIGLLGMRERLILLGGALQITSCPGLGTCLVAQVPLADANTDGSPLEEAGAALGQDILPRARA